MDLNADGKIDILSGCYAHDANKEGMAGLFSMFWGERGRTWKRAEVLRGSDGAPLIITPGNGKDPDLDRICTRPTAVDLDGDGKLDIVSGNFRGTFAFFAGEGKGKFAPKSTLLMADGAPLSVRSHSDPFFVDWDGDGDFDLVTGSDHGDVYLSVNGGSATEPKFQKPRSLVEHDKSQGETKFGDEHLIGPRASTRVCVGDVNGDGRLDLLVGDSVTLCHPAKGVSPAVAAKKQRDFMDKSEELRSKRPAEGVDGAEAATKKFNDQFAELRKERDKFVIFEETGFVWVLYQKSDGPQTQR